MMGLMVAAIAVGAVFGRRYQRSRQEDLMEYKLNQSTRWTPARRSSSIALLTHPHLRVIQEESADYSIYNTTHPAHLSPRASEADSINEYVMEDNDSNFTPRSLTDSQWRKSDDSYASAEDRDEVLESKPETVFHDLESSFIEGIDNNDSFLDNDVERSFLDNNNDVDRTSYVENTT